MAKKSIAELTLHKLEYGVGAPAIPYDGSTRYVRITDIDDDGCLGADFVSPEYYEEKHVLQDGDILFARTGATVGKSFMYTPSYGKCVYAGFLIRMIPNKEQVLPSYVYYFTKSPSYNSFIAQNMKVVAQPNINAKQYASLTFEVPSLPDQAVVVKKLDKITTLISLRKQQIAKLDELVKARFVEMFGEPAANPMKWKLMRITDVCDDICGGGTPSKSHPEYYEGNIPWVSPKDMKSLVISDSIDHITEAAIENSTARLIPANSVLMVIRSGILKHTLPVAINNVPVTVNQDMKAFIPGKEITASYLMYYFKAIESDVLSGVRAVTADNIDFKAFQKRSVMVPPLSLQHQFAAFVAQTDQQKLSIQHSLAQLELLKKALMQKYFG